MSNVNASEKLKSLQVDQKQEERDAARENIRDLRQAVWVMLGAFIWWVCMVTNGIGWVIQFSGWKDDVMLFLNIVNLGVFLGAFFFARKAAKQIKTTG